MDYVSPAYIQRIGDPQFPRFVFRDSIGQYFTPDGRWSEYFQEAELFYCEADAIAAQNRIFNGEHVRDTYTLKIVVTTDRDAWSQEELVKHLKRYGKVWIRRIQEKRGVVVEVIWNDLRKTE